MAVGFPLYTDADVLGPLVDALRSAGWDLVRAVDLYPQGEDDLVHFERAAKEGRVLVAVDEDQERIAHRWLREGRPFRGLVTWEKDHERHMSVGDFLRAFEDLSRKSDAFAYPIQYIKPKA